MFEIRFDSGLAHQGKACWSAETRARCDESARPTRPSFGSGPNEFPAVSPTNPEKKKSHPSTQGVDLRKPSS